MGQARKRHVAGEFKAHVVRGDEVVVRGGRSLGERGRVLSVDPQRERAVVEGVNQITKHQRAQAPGRQAAAQTQESGRVEMPAPVHVSNLMVVCPGCGKPTRVAHKQEEGRSVRACKKCGATLDRAQ